MVCLQSLSRRLCGVPNIDLSYLKRHTTYTSGLSESDAHIVAFWEVLESFSQAELRKFVKFACNQERIPSAGGEQGGNVQHVPPFPMKLAPPDDAGKRAGSLDQRFIRAETCMFMIKLPQYSSKVSTVHALALTSGFTREPVGNNEDSTAASRQLSRGSVGGLVLTRVTVSAKSIRYLNHDFILKRMALNNEIKASDIEIDGR